MTRDTQQATPVDVEAEERVRVAIRAAEAEADKGAFISSDAVENWVRSWGSDEEHQPPQLDVAARR